MSTPFAGYLYSYSKISVDVPIGIGVIIKALSLVMMSLTGECTHCQSKVATMAPFEIRLFNKKYKTTFLVFRFEC